MIFVHAIYRDPQAVTSAVDELLRAGFAAHDINAVVYCGESIEDAPIQHTTGVAAGLVIGGLVGGLLGALVMMVGFASADTPMFELGLRGWAAGAAFGLLAGVLGGLGYWKIKIDLPKDAFHRGARVLLGVGTNEGRVKKAKRALLRAGGRMVSEETSRQLQSGMRI